MIRAIVNDHNDISLHHNEGQWYVNDQPVDADIRLMSGGLISILYKGKSYTAWLEKTDPGNKELTLRIDGQSHKVRLREPIDQLLSSMGMDMKAGKKAEPVRAPMPGMVLRVLVEPGQEIHKGDGLLVLEAMKMENVLKATGTARVKAIRISEKTAVEKGTVLIELE